MSFENILAGYLMAGVLFMAWPIYKKWTNNVFIKQAMIALFFYLVWIITWPMQLGWVLKDWYIKNHKDKFWM